MVHARQHASEQNQALQRQNWQRVPDSLHSTNGGGCGGLFFARDARQPEHPQLPQWRMIS